MCIIYLYFTKLILFKYFQVIYQNEKETTSLTVVLILNILIFINVLTIEIYIIMKKKNQINLK